MKFELQNHQRTCTDADIVEDIRRVANEKGVDYLPLSDYKTAGRFSQCAIQGHFGTWKRALGLSGLRTERTQTELKRVPDDNLYEDLRRVAGIIRGSTVSLKDYERLGHYSSGNIFRRFGTWDSFLSKSGLNPTGLSKKRVSRQDCYDEIERIWIQLGRQPTSTDIIKRGMSKYSIDTFKRRFGGWFKALESFVAYVNEGATGGITSYVRGQDRIANASRNSSAVQDEPRGLMRKREHRTSRNVNARLRFQVLSRDHFKCCCCGASPAKDPSVELHVDHILPWVEGGETIAENLQTLCSRCNLGKGGYV